MHCRNAHPCRHLKAQLNLLEYGHAQPMGAYKQGCGGLSGQRGTTLLRAMARQTARSVPTASSVQWSQTLDDMVALREHGCSELPAHLVYCEWLQALLLSGQFRLASDYLRSGILQEKIDANTGERPALFGAVAISKKSRLLRLMQCTPSHPPTPVWTLAALQ